MLHLPEVDYIYGSDMDLFSPQDLLAQSSFEFQARKGDIKKREIIEAAIDCLATVGLESTTYEAIAKRIGTRRAHVAYHFSDKQQIFLHAVRYIMATYQQILHQELSRSQDGLKLILLYARTPFKWARKYPNQLAVMILFYYLCTFREEYRELHETIRRSGVERLRYILTNRFEPAYTAAHSRKLSKLIQNLITGSIIDSATTQSRQLEVAERELVSQIKRWLRVE